MTKRRIEPILWLLFSGGGVLAAVFLPILVLLFGLAFPLGWVTPPDHAHLLGVASHPLTLLFLFVLFVLLLSHWAHRFRYTLYDGLQLKRLRAPIAVLCYGGAVLGSLASLLVLWTVA
jgi:fumarate reductase subunit D